MKLRDIPMVLALCLLPAGVQAQDQDEGPLRALSETYTRAWNKQNAADVAALYATDAILTTPQGETFRGREAIQKALGPDLDKKLKLTLSAAEYRWLGKDAAVWRYEWKLAGSGTGTSRGTGLATLARAGDNWQIVEELGALSPEAPAAEAEHGHPHGDGEHPHGEAGGHDHGDGAAHDH